jgi:hypothetical protein
MGLDAKGRNFSAPRLTPGKTSEFLCYGSPEMIAKQNREIAIMEARARRYGFGGMRSVNMNMMGDSSSIATGLSRVPYGTTTDQNEVAITARPITDIANPNHRSTMANSAAASKTAQKTVGTIAVVIILLACFAPFIIGILVAILEIAGEF